MPVDWIDDPDSRGEIVSTARDDLRGVARLALEVAVLVTASMLATVTRYVALRAWVFARRGEHAVTVPARASSLR